MPRDVRRLYFTATELKEALALYCAAKGICSNAPIDSIKIVQIAGDAFRPETLQADIVFLAAKVSLAHKVSLDEAKILESLIGFSRSLEIPLPRRPQKFLKVKDNGIVLSFGVSDKDIQAALGA